MRKIEIKGFNGKYFIFEDGRVWTTYHKNGLERFLAQIPVARGYLVVNLYDETGMKQKRVHQLVAEAFVPNPGKKPHVNHKDGNTSNNHVNNLEWCTPKENVHHSIYVLKRWSNSQKQRKSASKTLTDFLRRKYAVK